MIFKKSFLLLFVLAITGCNEIKKETSIADDEQSLPNIVYILADDMGYGDVSALNPDSGVRTPHMDKLVAQGIHFTDAHTNSSVCTPTRYGILTGRYAWRSRLKQGVLWGYDPPLIEENRTTVASFLKGQGYHTACIGKWHLGLGWRPKNPDLPIVKYQKEMIFEKGSDSNVDFGRPASGPNTLGFEYSYIIPASLDMSPYVYLENEKATELPTAYTPGKSQDKDGRGVFWRTGEMGPSFDFDNVLGHLTDKATQYIAGQKANKEPFFLYFPLTAPHTPWLPTGKAVGKSEAGRYGDFVAMVDDAVGAVVEALEKTGKLDNTLIIVTSDNGSNWTPEDKQNYAHRANYIYRGQKADIYEGGHRVPFIVRWPKKINPGSASHQVMCTTDLMATIAGAINKPLPENAGEDSYNFWPALTEKDTQPIRDFTIHHSSKGYFSIRKGKWKMTPFLGSGGFTTPINNDPDEVGFKGTLYDMENDPKETINLYNTNIDVREDLLKLLETAKQ